VRVPPRNAFALPVRATVLALVLAFPLAAGARAQRDTGWWGTPAVGLGPIILRSQAPLSLLRLTPTPLQPVTLAKGAWLTGVVANWNNYFAVDPRGRFFIDAETFAVTLGVGYGLSERTELDLAMPLSYRGGGTLDGFVERFEGVVGQINRVRRSYPRDRYTMRIVGENGQVHELSGRDAGWGTEDPSMSLRYQVAKGTLRTPAIVVSAGLNAPIGSQREHRSTGSSDVYLAVGLGQRLGRFNLYASLAGMRYGRILIDGVRLNRHQGSFFVGLEYRKSARTSWLVQGVVTSAGTKSYGDFAASSYEVTFGFKRRLARELLLEVSVLENLFVFNNSPDVGFHVGVVKRIGERAGRP